MQIITKDSPGIEIELTCEPEETPVRGNALASGDDADDRAAEDKVIAELNRGNEWAWCCAKVTVTYRGTLSASDYLGGCSYDSEADFGAPGGYYDDMVSTCIDEINAKLAKLGAE